MDGLKYYNAQDKKTLCKGHMSDDEDDAHRARVRACRKLTLELDMGWDPSLGLV